MPDPDTDISPQAARQPEEEGYVEDAPENEYDPSDIEVNRGRMQGLGVGARDLARQGDPDRDLASDLGLEQAGDDDDAEDDTAS